MNAVRKLKQAIMATAFELNSEHFNFGPVGTDSEVDDEWERFTENDYHYDYVVEFRGGEYETEIPTEYSRNYESKSVAAMMLDGSYVGWTYWYGGGKHGETEAIEWIEDAYDVDCVKEEKVVVVRTFTKK